MGEPKLKILECDDKDVLRMPSGAVHLWLFYRMHADQLEESYFSVRSIAALIGQDTKTVIKWQEYLINCGRLVKTGEVAANRYSKPTRGSHQVPVVRVNSAGNIPTLETPNNTEESSVGESYCRKNSYKGSSVLCSGSAPLISPLLDAVRVDSFAMAERKDKSEEEPKTLKPKTQTRRVAKDGTPIPMDIDTWTLDKRLAWSQVHNGTGKAKANSNGYGNVSGPKEATPKAKPKSSLSEWLYKDNPVQLGNMTDADMELLERDMFGDDAMDKL
jgi:hypothetical protein